MNITETFRSERKRWWSPVLAGFAATFAEAMQMPPVRFLNYLRVQWAKRLLGRNGLNLSSLALKVGFGNINNLNKWFKVFEKSSPSQYRQKPGNP